MITFNLNNIAKGETIKGGLTPVRVLITAFKIKLWQFLFLLSSLW